MRAAGTGPNSEFVVQNELVCFAPRLSFQPSERWLFIRISFTLGKGAALTRALGAGLFQDKFEIMKSLDAQTISMLEAWPL